MDSYSITMLLHENSSGFQTTHLRWLRHCPTQRCETHKIHHFECKLHPFYYNIHHCLNTTSIILNTTTRMYYDLRDNQQPMDFKAKEWWISE